MFHALIMAGGSGTRLWPLSRDLRPKQILRLVGDRSMFQHAVERLSPLFPDDRIWIVTRSEHAGLLQAQVESLHAQNFILEPEGRGTAPAIGLGAIHLQKRDPDALMAVLTADHYISDTNRFREALSVAEEMAQKGHLVTLGIKPSAPSSAFGYIEQGKQLERIADFDVYQVRAFTEKPNRETAARMVSSGIFTWNSGMFIWKVSRILDEFQRWMPDFYRQLMTVADALGTPDYETIVKQVWPQITKETIDYGVMEKANDIVVIPVEMGWSDIGSWESFFELLPADEQQNIVQGPHIGINTSNSLILGESRLIATLGIDNLVVVDSGDALLICKRGHEQKVKDLIENLKAQGRDDLL